MWNESRVLSWPLMFRRQYAQPIDIDSVFETLAEMNAYLSNTLRYIGQIATCQETEGIIYIMNNNRDAWVTVDTGGGTLIFSTLTELNTYLSDNNRVAGSIATCNETEGIIYILNNLRNAWITIDINSKLDTSLFYSHTAITNAHNVTFNNLVETAHTHSVAHIDNLQNILNNKLELSPFNLHISSTNGHNTSFNNLISTAHTHNITDTNGLASELETKLYTVLFNTHTATTNAHNVSFNNLINTAHTHNISDINNLETQLNSKLNLSGGELTGNLTAVTYYGDGSKLTGIIAGVDVSLFNSHTGDTSIHFTKNSINISDINSAHTHQIADVSNLQTTLNNKTDLSSFNAHTGATNPHGTSFNNLTSTAHTHIISDVSNLQSDLNSKLNLTGGTLTGDLTGTTIAATTLSASTYIGIDSSEVKNLSILSGNTITDVLNNATLSTDGIVLYPTDMIAGIREEVVSGTTVQVNKFWSGELFTKPKQFVVFDKDTPLATDDYNIFIPDTNITITKVYFKTKATTVNFNINHSSNVDIWTVDKQATTTVQMNDVINNPNCLAGLPIKYQASAIGTTPGNIHVTIYYTEG